MLRRRWVPGHGTGIAAAGNGTRQTGQLAGEGRLSVRISCLYRQRCSPPAGGRRRTGVPATPARGGFTRCRAHQAHSLGRPLPRATPWQGVARTAWQTGVHIYARWHAELDPLGTWAGVCVIDGTRRRHPGQAPSADATEYDGDRAWHGRAGVGRAVVRGVPLHRHTQGTAASTTRETWAHTVSERGRRSAVAAAVARVASRVCSAAARPNATRNSQAPPGQAPSPTPQPPTPTSASRAVDSPPGGCTGGAAPCGYRPPLRR